MTVRKGEASEKRKALDTHDPSQTDPPDEGVLSGGKYGSFWKT